MDKRARFTGLCLFFAITMMMVGCLPGKKVPKPVNFTPTFPIPSKEVDTAKPASTSVPYNTRIPTVTPLPTATATTTPIAPVTYLNIPDWLSKNQTVLMYRFFEEQGINKKGPVVHFLDPETGQEYSLNMPDAFMCWKDPAHVVFAHDPEAGNLPPFLFLFNIDDGSLRYYSESDPLFSDYYFSPLEGDTCPKNPPMVPDTRVKIDSENPGEWTAYTMNPATGELNYLTSQSDGIFDLDAITSPNRTYAVITQTAHLGANFGAGDRLSIFNLIDRKLVLRLEAGSISAYGFRGDDNFIYKEGWNAFCLFTISSQEKKCLQAPEGIYDGGAILSQNGRYLVAMQSNNIYQASSMWEAWGNRISVLDLVKFEEVTAFQETDFHDLQFIDGSLSFLYMRQRKTPCIFDISTLAKKCINQITSRFPKDTIELDKIVEDPQSLIFFHWGGEDGKTGGLCFFTLYNGDLNCPMDGLPDLKGQVVTEYELSPDGKYIAFSYEDDGCHDCDVAGKAGLGVISKIGQRYYNLGPSNAPRELRYIAMWRPIVSENMKP